MDEIRKVPRYPDLTHALSTETLDAYKNLQSELDVSRRLLGNDTLRKFVEEMNRSENMIRAAMGPMAEIQAQAALITNSPAHERAVRVFAEIETRFKLPGMLEIQRLAERQLACFDNVSDQYKDIIQNAVKASEMMQSRWLDISNELDSLRGFAALQNVGRVLDSMPAFSDEVGALLRSELGDWRDTIQWPQAIFEDAEARGSFYIAQGFDPNLTAFPPKAFDEAVTIARLRREPPPLVEAYGAPVFISDDPAEEAGFSRTNLAHEWLLRLETQMRRFIDDVMTAEVGPNWQRQRLPNGMYEQWVEKKKSAESAGGPSLPLIAYADFRDYEQIICRRDNWKLFEAFFRRPESVRESMQRLYPIRICTMHARIVTQDDEIILYAETRQLTKAIACGPKKSGV